MIKELLFTDIEVQVENYTFLVIRASKDYKAERFSLQMKNGPKCFFDVYDSNSEFLLFPSNSASKEEQTLIYWLDTRKEFLINLYQGIRNHTSLRLKLLHSLGRIKQY